MPYVKPDCALMLLRSTKLHAFEMLKGKEEKSFLKIRFSPSGVLKRKHPCLKTFNRGEWNTFTGAAHAH